MSTIKQSRLKNSVAKLAGIGAQKAALLQSELGIRTWEDLLRHYPFRYVDRTKVHTIRDIDNDRPFIQLRGTITSLSVVGSLRKKRLVAKLKDGTGTIELVWFAAVSYWAKTLKQGSEYLVFGRPTFFRNNFSINHPEIELVSQQKLSLDNRIMPVYHGTEKLKKRGLDSSGIAKLIKQVLNALSVDDFPEFLPSWVVKERSLIGRASATKHIHVPANLEAISLASNRLKFEEFFISQIQISKLKINREKFVGYVFDSVGTHFNKFYNDQLKFELTGAQKRVLKEIRRDTMRGIQMNRLLQGDVGSGKTVVGLMSMLIAIDNGFQTALMAPTEILAQQHYKGISEMLQGMGLKVALLTGSVKGKKRSELLRFLRDGDLDILIGTHALIEDHVVFKNLGMVIIDEQHRFGVAQRAKLWEKSELPPHVLVMTATPIPRTLAMTVYGDLDISVIDELPPGRKPVKTVHHYDSSRLEIFGFMEKQIKLGRQVYVVYPLIDESANMDYKDLNDGYESIVRAFPPPEYMVSVVNGRQKAADKEMEMQRFVEGKTQIMVATTVIEVGVNVPNASVMIIESAERFGLSQLHQLRGRVGRGADQSFCILMTGYKLSSDSKLRLKTMTDTNDGFEIAQVDMELRGAGDMYGTRQSGRNDFKIADILLDKQLLQETREIATSLMKDDPNLSKPDHLALRSYLENKHSTMGIEWSKIS